jgi:ATP-binding cassette subfamily F protein uup
MDIIMPISSTSILARGIDLSLSYGEKVILQDASFSLKPGEIVCVIGRNGSGKSTFLKILSHTVEPDSGTLEFKSGVTVEYLSQEFGLDDTLTVFETVAKSWFKYKTSDEIVELAADLVSNYTPWKNLDENHHSEIFSQVYNQIYNLGCPDSTKLIANLSGGEKRKVALAAALIARADILILDEPTNHLDIGSIEKLENSLKDYTGCVLLVSHDRYFLDKLVTRMIEIYDGQMYDHQGNYEQYLEDKSLRLEIAGTQEERKQAFLKRELQWVRAGVKARGTKDKGRLDRFYNLKDEKKLYDEGELELLLPPNKPLGNKIINLENVSLSVGHKKILTDFSFDFQADTVLGLIGENGSGKTSLIKAILGELSLTSGKIVVGQNTSFNYQDQEKLNLNPEATPFEELAHGLERMDFGETTINTRSYLRRFLFDNRQIMSPIKSLSGGQKARILLAKVLKQAGNCLILDEPTNDLDLETISLLEESILQFSGVTILVSHDRYFLNRVCNTILALEGDGKFTLSTGNYDDYLTKKQPIKGINQAEKTIQDPFKISQKEIRENQKEMKSVERQIETLEARIKEVELLFSDPDFYTKTPDKYTKKAVELEQAKQKLEELMIRWEELSLIK